MPQNTINCALLFISHCLNIPTELIFDFVGRNLLKKCVDFTVHDKLLIRDIIFVQFHLTIISHYQRYKSKDKM